MLGSIISTIGNLIGGNSAAKATEAANRANIAMQMAFAKNAVQWKTEDARKAGIHPIYALGAPTMSPSVAIQANTAMGDAMARSGQDIGRAVEATMNSTDRVYAKAAQAETLKRMGLENMLLETQLLKARQPAIPSFPGGQKYATGLEGQGSAAVFEADPRIANVTAPSGDVDAIKAFGYPLIRNPRLFSSGDQAQKEFGEGGEWVIGVPALIEAFSRSIMMQNLSDVKFYRDKLRKLGYKF